MSAESVTPSRIDVLFNVGTATIGARIRSGDGR